MQSRANLFPVTVLLALALFLTGLSSAAIAPYRGVMAIEELGFSNGAFATMLTINALATAAASVLLGRLSDRVGDRRLLVIFSAVVGGLAYGLIWLVPGQASYAIAFCLMLPFGGALFSQSFAFSRVYYTQQAPARAEMMTSVLRTMFSLSWVLVPPMAGWIAAAVGLRPVFALAAAGSLGVTLVFVVLLTREDARLPPPARVPKGRVDFWAVLPPARLIGIGGVLFMRMAILLHLMVMPLAMLNDFGGTYADVGFTAAVAAGIEVPCMLAWGWAAGRWPKEPILALNGALFAAYLGLLLQARSPADVLWLQGLNAIATAALLSLTITYMQETIKGQVGLSTALLDVVSVTASLLAAGLFRAFAGDGSYVLPFAAAAVLCLTGAGMMLASRRAAAV